MRNDRAARLSPAEVASPKRSPSMYVVGIPNASRGPSVSGRIVVLKESSLSLLVRLYHSIYSHGRRLRQTGMS